MTLRQARLATDYTQEALASVSGVKRNIIAMVETGKRKLQVEAAKQLAPHLGVNWWELFDDNDKEATEP